jgi:phage tail-like protein
VSTRGSVAELASPVHLADSLPGLFQDDEIDARTGRLQPNFLQRFTGALDEVLAPVFSCLDNLDAYLDPRLAPPDFLDWLAAWLGEELDETWTIERRRELVLRAVELYRWRGTARGLAAAVAIYTGVEPEIVDSGGVAWSTEPDNPLPGNADARVVVRIDGEHAADVDRARLERLVAAAKPAHLIAEITVEAP